MFDEFIFRYPIWALVKSSIDITNTLDYYILYILANQFLLEIIQLSWSLQSLI